MMWVRAGDTGHHTASSKSRKAEITSLRRKPRLLAFAAVATSAE
jgi:ribosomal protein L24E